MASHQQTEAGPPDGPKTSKRAPFDSEDAAPRLRGDESNNPVVYSATFEKVTRASAVTDLVIMANAAGANAWKFDKPKNVKLSVVTTEGKLKEYELPQPHEGILLLMFPRVDEENS